MGVAVATRCRLESNVETAPAAVGSAGHQRRVGRARGGPGAMGLLSAGLVVALASLAAEPEPVRVVVPFVEADEIDLAELVGRLAGATGLNVARPPGLVTLP